MQRSVVFSALFLLVLGAVPVAAQKPVTREIALEMAADEGRWAAVKGKMQEDGTFLAKEIELIALGDAEGTEVMEVRGVMGNLNTEKRSLRAMNYAIVWTEETRIRDNEKNKIQASELKNDVGATIEGHYEDGVFVAKDIRVRAGKIKDGELVYKQEIIGPFQVIDARAGLLRVIDTDVRLRPDCAFFELPMQVKNAGN